MRILVACEESGIVRDAFIKRGHNAISCDLLPSRRPGPHFQMDVFKAINFKGRFDMLIAFPPCDHLAISGAHLFDIKKADGRQKKAIEFFMMLASSYIPKIAIENPVGIMSTIWREPNQIIQPYEFGEDASKQTCLWLKNLPRLIPTTKLLPATKLVPGRQATFFQPEVQGRQVVYNGKLVDRYSNQTDSGQNKLGPSKTRKRDRAETYHGIALAMASQWG